MNARLSAIVDRHTRRRAGAPARGGCDCSNAPKDTIAKDARALAATDFMAGRSHGLLTQFHQLAEDASARWSAQKNPRASSEAKARFALVYREALIGLHRLPLTFDPRFDSDDRAGRRRACQAFVAGDVCFNCWHELSEYAGAQGGAFGVGADAFIGGFLEAARALRGD